MPHRSELKCVANGLLGSFMSRNNDYAGYWALGMLYARALEHHEKNYSLALLSAGPKPTDGLSRALVATYEAFLLKSMSSRGIPNYWVESVRLSIDFEHSGSLPYHPASPSRPFLARVLLGTSFGKSIPLQRSGSCWPHNPDRESRSNRSQPGREHGLPDA